MNTLHYPGAALARYRTQTDRQAQMPGATKPSFICKSCGQSKLVNGRKARVTGYSRAGYDCAECAAGNG